MNLTATCPLAAILPAIILLTAACQPLVSGTAGGDAAGTVAAEVVDLPPGLGVETVVEGLEIPWELAFTPDGRILITERPGRIRVVEDGKLQETPYATMDVFHRSEAGLMGITLHPDFAANGFLYVCYTYREGRSTFNRIARLTDRGDLADDHHVILDRIPGATRHDGCRIRFGPDGYLYATTGDATVPHLSQDLDSLAGKVLRMAADGSVPPDNPFPRVLGLHLGPPESPGPGLAPAYRRPLHHRARACHR